MSLTLGMTGMDPATETALRAAFGDANARVGARWSLVAETDAAHVMVDMDSMYGPMSWLRLHAAGKRVIGLTTAPRTQTDFRLGRPFDSEAFAALLREIEHDRGMAPASGAGAAAATPVATVDPAIPTPQPGRSPTGTTAAAGAPAAPSPASAPPVAPGPSSDSAPSAPPAAVETPSSEAPAAARPVVDLSPALPLGSTPAPTPRDQLPEERVAAATVHDAAPADDDATAGIDSVPAAPRERSLADWLAPGALSRRVRYRRSAGPMLLIDPVARTYHGPSTLKPFSAYFRDVVADADFETLDDAAWDRDSTVAGAAQPLLRLQWLGAMVNGRAALSDDHAAGTRFKLTKWPQTEREFPKHFRIATAMMKGPATLAEIADASTMPIDEVFEFVNANLVTGFAERVVEAPVDASPDTARAGGLLGRFRTR